MFFPQFGTFSPIISVTEFSSPLSFSCPLGLQWHSSYKSLSGGFEKKFPYKRMWWAGTVSPLLYDVFCISHQKNNSGHTPSAQGFACPAPTKCLPNLRYKAPEARLQRPLYRLPPTSPHTMGLSGTIPTSGTDRLFGKNWLTEQYTQSRFSLYTFLTQSPTVQPFLGSRTTPIITFERNIILPALRKLYFFFKSKVHSSKFKHNIYKSKANAQEQSKISTVWSKMCRI